MSTLVAMPPLPPPAPAPKPGFERVAMIPFILMHLLVAGAFFVHVSWQAWVCCALLYGARMFGVTAGYHRYFAHRTYKTSRTGQFLLALLAQSSSQKGVLWWAAHHRTHHKHSDAPKDLHSVKQDGFWYAHVGWIYNHTSDTDFSRVRDLAKYPELVFLNRHWWLPPAVLGLLCTLLLGAGGFFIGFVLSTVLVWHATFAINSLAHMCGSRRFNTDDESRNNLWLALLTLGEGWHNNHHHHMHSTRQGFRLHEIDATYYALRLLSLVGLVWDIREPPAALRA